jgi:hypothetical protein
MADPTKPVLSLDEIAKNSSTDFNQFTNAGKTFSFDAEGADRYLTYGSKVYGQLGYNPFGNNEKKYQQATSWTKDISRGFTGMTKLAGVGMSDTFGFGAFGSSENHKDFGKIMQDYGSQRGGVSGFFANTMLSAGYTVGIISSIAAEELLLAGATALSGGLLSGATVPAMGAEVARGASLLGKANKTLKGVDNTVGVFGWMKNIDNARWYKEAKDAGAVGMGAVGSLSRGVGGFGKALMPLGNTLDFIRSADKIKDFNGLQKTLLGAGSIARDARKFYMSHSESDLEAKFVRDELTTDAIAKWNRANPGQSMPESVKNFIDIKAQKAYNRAYETNFGLIYLTNAITFEGLLKGFSPTNKLFGMVDNFSVAGKGSRSIAFNAVTPTVKNYIKKKASELTLGNVIGGTVRASMEGVQEYGQDIISSAAKKYGDIKFEIKGYEKDVFGKPVLNGEGKKIPIYGKMITDPTSDMSRGAYWSQVANSMGDSNIETFMSGALMGIFASPVNFATKVVSEYSFGERGFGSEYNAWTKEGKKNYKNLLEERQKTAEFLTEISKKQGIALEVDITSPVHRMTGLREKMLEAARNGDQKFFEDNKAEIFRLGMRSMFKTGTHGELVDHLDQMLKHSAKELNESLDRIDITEENKEEYYDKIKQRKKDILKLKEEYDRIEEEMPSKGNVDAVFRNDRLSPEEKQEAVLDILAWDELKEEMLFTGDKVRNLSQRKENIKSDLKKNTKLTDLDVVALTNESDLAQQIDMLTTQVESNKEYKLDNTREHQQLVIKLDALKSLQESLQRFNDPKFNKKNATSVQKEHDAMEDAFARYMLAVNTELNSMPDASALASDKNLYQRYKRRFAPLFDFYRLDEESKELEYYADLLSNPEYSSQWLRANREMLVEFGKNKKAYIEKAIEAWQTREVSDDMLNELLENGIIFELDELDDLFGKDIMPSTLFDVNSKEEISAEKYKQAVKIIEKYYKKLKGKKLIGAKTGVRATRDKSKTDKRRAATIIKQYVGAKNKGVPVPIIDFVNNMMAYGNRYLSKSEIRILEKLQEYHITNKILSGNVILTDEAESPVSFNENGDLVLDVRFGAFDFARANYEINGVKYSSIAQLDKAVNSNKITESQYDQGVRALRATPFEYIAISGIVQNVFVKRFQVDEELKNNITTLMDLAKTSHINNINNSNKNDQQKRMEIAQAETSDIFNNPLVFLTEAYANINFQNFLASTVNSTDVNQESLWRNLNNELRDELGANGIKGSLLDSILGITQLSIDEATIEDTAESGPIQETDETDEVEEDEEPTPEEMEGEETAPVANVPPEEEVEEEQVTEEPAPVPVNLNELADRKKVINLKIKKLQQDVNGINSEISRTSRLKFRRIGQLEKQKLAIQKEVDTLIKELKSIEQKEKSVTETPIAATPDLKTPVLNEEDDDSNQVVTSRSEFINLPLDLQLKLAAFYLNNNKGKASLISIEKLQELQARDEKDIPDNVQGFLKKVSEDDAVAFKEAVFRGFNLLALQGDEKALDYLTDEQIQEIQDLMPTTSFINIIGEYNRNANKQPAPAVTETTEEEDEEENDEAKPLILSAEAIKELNDANQRALDNIQEVFIDRNLRYTTTFINHLGEEVTITENSRTVLEQLINDTYSENGWANNINNIVGVEFEAIIGDRGTEAKVTITIDKVKITPQGNYQIYATRSDANKRYNILVGRSGMIYTFTETDTGIVSKAEDKVNYIVDFTTKASIVPFDPNRKEPKIEYTSPIQSVDDIQSVYPDIDLTTVFTTEQLNEFATELANATSIEEFKKLAEAFDQTLFDITEGFTDGLTFDIPVAEGETIDEGEVIESTIQTPIDFSTLGTLKTEEELKESSGVPADEFDEVTSNVKYNWNYLDTSKHNYEGTNKGYASRFSTWSINKRDLAYLRNFQISLFGLEHLDFVDAVLKYLSNGSRLAETVSKFNVKNKSVTQVENYVRTQLNNAANNRAITSELVNALNKKLNAVRSNLTIAWSESKRKVGNYGITTKTQAQIDTMQQQQDKLDTKSTKLSRKEQALLFDTGNDVRALVLKWFIQGGKINSSAIQELLGNTKSLKGPKSIKAESAARMSILNNTTGLTLDGLAHTIWENRNKTMNFDTEDAKKEVVDVILRFGGISKMIDELINTYGQPEIETEETEEEKRNREFKEAEEQEAYEYNQILNAYWESEGSNVNQIYLDFEATTLGQILNGTYQGTREDLANDVERRAYDEIYKDTTKKPDVEEDVEEEEFVPKTAIDPIVKKVREYDVNTISGMNSVQKVGTMFNLITANSTFEDLVYIYLSLYNTSTAYSDNQKNSVIRSIKYRLASFSNQIFSPSRTMKINEFQSSTDVVPAGVYEITPINTNTNQRVLFGLKNQLTNEIFQVEGITELFPSIADIYEPGSTLNTNPVDLSLNNNDVEIIKASFTDFFSNFNNIMSDVDKDLNEEDLRSQIAEQFKTCK